MNVNCLLIASPHCQTKTLTIKDHWDPIHVISIFRSVCDGASSPPSRPPTCKKTRRKNENDMACRCCCCYPKEIEIEKTTGKRSRQGTVWRGKEDACMWRKGSIYHNHKLSRNSLSLSYNNHSKALKKRRKNYNVVAPGFVWKIIIILVRPIIIVKRAGNSIKQKHI